MQRRQFIHSSSLSLFGISISPVGLITDTSPFNADWNHFTGQNGVVRSFSATPGKIVHSIEQLLPAGVTPKQMKPIYTYEDGSSAVFFTAFELHATQYPLKQYLLPFWQKDKSGKIKNLRLLNAHELACLVDASKSTRHPFLPQLDTNAADQLTLANGRALQKRIRIQDGELVHEWQVLREEKMLAVGSFKRKAETRI